MTGIETKLYNVLIVRITYQTIGTSIARLL